jgi:glycosyltransferase involved in cell wall biosynthesis
MSSVDVIVPCYNYAHFLTACVESILGQAGVDVRALVIDDASPDDTERVGRALASRDPRVDYRRHARNIGHIATYNEGIDWAEADYLLVLSADDLLTPGALGRAARLMDAHPDVGLSYGRAIRTHEPARHPPRIPDPCKTRVLTGLELIEAFCEWGGNRVPTQAAVVRTAVQKAVGGYRAELPHSGDMEMWLRIAARGPVGVVDADQAYYRVHPTNMHHGFVAASVKDMDEYRRTFEVFFAEHEVVVQGAGRLRDVAMRSLAQRALWKAGSFLDNGDGRGAAELQEFALRASPGVRRSSLWYRVRLKQALGPRLWSLVRRALGGRASEDAPPGWSRIGLFPEM